MCSFWSWMLSDLFRRINTRYYFVLFYIKTMSTVTKLNVDIIASGIFNNWGGECINKTDREVPYGIGISNGQNNIFGYEDGHDVSGYMYTLDISPDNNSVYNKEIRINVYQKKSITEMDSYQAAINLHHYLKVRKFDPELKLEKGVQCEFCYFAYIVVKIRSFPDNCL